MMNDPSINAINTIDDVYKFVARLKAESERHGAATLAAALDDALQLGSSGLEILGGIRQVIIHNRTAIEHLLGARGNEADQVVLFVDRAFGRRADP